MRIIYSHDRYDWILVFNSPEEAQTAKEILEDLIADKNAKEQARAD